MTNTAHRIELTTRYGARDTVRVFGAPDRDSAIIGLIDKIGAFVTRSVEAIDADAPYVWGENTVHLG